MAEAQAVAIPGAADLTPEWWTKTLRQAGYDATVRSVCPTKIGTGQMGENIRFFFEYSGERGQAPETVVGKFPSSNSQSIEAAKIFGAYRREISFYRELSASCCMAIPALIYADFDAASERFILIMGDLAPAEQGDQTKGVTLEQARLALMEAAKLHASHWQDPRIETLPWLYGAPGSYKVTKDTMVQLWSGFRQRFGDKLDDYSITIGEVLIEKFERLMYDHASPICLLHNDFRPDNMAFAGAQGGRPITIFDWQTVGAGPAMKDVAYFMGGALPPEIRAKEEGGLVRLYHETLSGLGISDYPFEQAWQDYRRYAGLSFLMAVSMAMMVERTERGDVMFLKTLKSSAEFMRAVDTLSVLRSL